MSKVNEILKEVRENITTTKTNNEGQEVTIIRASSSKKDEIRVMKEMLNDKEYEVGVYTNKGKLNLFNAKYELDDTPIEEGCGCPACKTYSRAYIRHLLKAKEMLGMRLCVLHNLYFYNHMMEEIRQAIEEGRYSEYKRQKLDGFKENDK